MKVAVSITAHESIGVLTDQIDNIQHFCPGAQLFIHLSQAFRRELMASPEHRLRLRRLCRHGEVVINSQSFETKWAYMFHAHLSNISMMIQSLEQFDHVLLLSSADLFFQHGILDQLRGFDACLDKCSAGFEAEPFNTWSSGYEADPFIRSLFKSHGFSTLEASMHEATAYRFDLVTEMVGQLARAGFDLLQNHGYPKEEFYFPTLVQQFPSLRLRPRLGVDLAMARGLDRDRLVTTRVLENIGPGRSRPTPNLNDWRRSVAASADTTPPEWPYFVVSRVPRHAGHPLRRILVAQALHDPGSIAALIDQFQLRDLFLIDFPGRLDFATPPTASDYFGQGILQAPIVELLTTAATDDAALPIYEFPACPDGYTAPQEISLSGVGGLPLQLCTAFQPTPLAITVQPTAKGLALARAPVSQGSLSSVEASSPSPMLFAFFACPPGLLEESEFLLCEYDADDQSLPFGECWFEYHHAQGKNHLGGVRPFLLGAATSGQTVGWLIPDDLRRFADRSHALGGVFHVYLVLRFASRMRINTIRLTQCSLTMATPIVSTR